MDLGSAGLGPKRATHAYSNTGPTFTDAIKLRKKEKNKVAEETWELGVNAGRGIGMGGIEGACSSHVRQRAICKCRTTKHVALCPPSPGYRAEAVNELSNSA